MQTSDDTALGLAARPMRIERAALHDKIVERLHDLITEGDLKPGERINERELAERLAVSRTPLREALRVLAAEKLVTISPNYGTFVTRMTRQEIHDTFELMSALERFSGELASLRITAEELADVREAHEAMLDHWQRHDLSAYYHANQRIHDLINRAARNDALRQTYLSLNRRLHPLRLSSNRSQAKWRKAVEEHRDMMGALEARDGPALGAVMERHLLEKRDAVLADWADD
ncbi:GntR family transcriptional regulator [Salinicola acroporae]|uniref:GntR family transcriptional regulator n=1 Tax=Salinicola acroporae TaxID=1541440 RepID=A0ABT6I429_9GAMM|nr:GntR family transcriptional regulator [Salinicola acroporae]MDH4572396.1 GntR family transcriptional regulator [Salinicola acroporae]